MLATKEQFEDWYLKENLSTHQIARKLNVCQNSIRYYFKKYGIKSRTLSDAQKVCITNPLRKPKTKEWKENMSKRQMGNTYCLGKHHSEETKKKISDAQTITGESKNSKEYKQLAYDTYPHKCNKCNCNTKSKLCVHHKDKNHFNNDIKNLEILCNSCHMSVHHKGFKHTDVTKAKMSISQKKRFKTEIHWNKGKKLNIIKKVQYNATMEIKN